MFSKTMFVNAIAAGLGAALALEFGAKYIPASVGSIGGGRGQVYIPVGVGAFAGLAVASLIK